MFLRWLWIMIKFHNWRTVKDNWLTLQILLIVIWPQVKVPFLEYIPNTSCKFLYKKRSVKPFSPADTLWIFAHQDYYTPTSGITESISDKIVVLGTHLWAPNIVIVSNENSVTFQQRPASENQFRWLRQCYPTIWNIYW